jgi:hypothetical protein
MQFSQAQFAAVVAAAKDKAANCPRWIRAIERATEEAPEASQSWIEKELHSQSPMEMPLAVLSTLIPMLLGAIRGTRHKLFCYLTYFAKRLPNQKQEEIQDFVRMIEQEYATTAQPAPR